MPAAAKFMSANTGFGWGCQLLREYIAKLDEFIDEARTPVGRLAHSDANVAERLRAANVSVKLVGPLQADQIAASASQATCR